METESSYTPRILLSLRRALQEQLSLRISLEKFDFSTIRSDDPEITNQDKNQGKQTQTQTDDEDTGEDEWWTTPPESRQ